jgi:hypothetical protein
MFAGEGAMLVPRLLRFALFHTLVSRSENLDVYLAERKLTGPSCGGLSFNVVDPVQEFAHGPVVATPALNSTASGTPALGPSNCESESVGRGGYLAASRNRAGGRNKFSPSLAHAWRRPRLS